MEHAGPVAILALLFVIPASVVVFSFLRPTHAVLTLFLGGMLFLPELVQLDLPLLPPFNKHSIPALCMLIGVLITARDRIAAARPGRGPDVLILIAAIAAVGTFLTNREPLHYGPTTLRALSSGDAISYIVNFLLGSGSAFFLGRAMFRTSADARDLLRALVIFTIIYSPFIVFELRMSPHIHYKVYGFMQHSFGQAVRGGGYRPMVFMAHGLALALFVCVAALAAWQLTKARATVLGVPSRLIAIALTVLLALMNSLGALVYGIVAVLVTWFLKPRTQLLVACVVALVVALYPLLRTWGVFPTQELVDLAARVSQDRAASLDFRFTNEDLLLEKALQKPLFGWGTWARNYVFTSWGARSSTVDGEWIAFMGAFGMIGFACRFGLLLFPIWVAFRRLKHVEKSDRPLLAGVAWAAILYALDLLPNGLFNEMPFFLSGSVIGLASGMPRDGRARALMRQVLPHDQRLRQ